MIPFHIVCTLTALVCVVLFGILLIAPGGYSAAYGVSADTSGDFLGNRAAPMFLGLACICWLLRHQAYAEVRTAISLSMIVIFAGIAMTGIWAYAQNVASATILFAAFGEALIAVAFAQTLGRTT